MTDNIKYNNLDLISSKYSITKTNIQLKSPYKEILYIYSIYIKRALDKIKANYSFINLPKKRKLYTLLRSPHVDKKARDQFDINIHKILFTINSPFSDQFLTNLLKNKPTPITIIIKKVKV